MINKLTQMTLGTSIFFTGEMHITFFNLKYVKKPFKNIMNCFFWCLISNIISIIFKVSIDFFQLYLNISPHLDWSDAWIRKFDTRNPRSMKFAVAVTCYQNVCSDSLSTGWLLTPACARNVNWEGFLLRYEVGACLQGRFRC